MSKESIWTKDFAVLFIINFFVALVFNLLIVTIAFYTIGIFHTSASIAGLAASIFIIGALTGRLTAGHLIGDTGGKNILITGLILNIIATALYLNAINLPLLLINRLIHGFAYGLACTTTATMIAQILPESRRGEGIGYYSMNVIVAQAIGPFIGIFLSQYASFKIIFICSVLLSVISLVLSFFVIQSVQTAVNHAKANTAKGFQLREFIEFRAVPIATVALIIGFSYSTVAPFLSVYAVQIDLIEAASFFYLVYSIFVLISRPVSGRLLDAKGANIVVYPTLLIFALGMLLYSQASYGITLLSAAVLIGLGYGNFHSCAQAIAIKVTPQHRYGLANSTYYLFYESGYAAGPYLMGLLIPLTGWRNLYLIMVMIILADIVVYYFLHGRKEKQRKPGKISGY